MPFFRVVLKGVDASTAHVAVLNLDSSSRLERRGVEVEVVTSEMPTALGARVRVRPRHAEDLGLTARDGMVVYVERMNAGGAWITIGFGALRAVG